MIELDQYLFGLITLICIGLFISWYASKCGYYQLPQSASSSVLISIPGELVFLAFLIFFIVELVLVPGVYLSWKELVGDTVMADSNGKSWMNMIGTVLLSIVLWGFCRRLDPVYFNQVWGQSTTNRFFNWLMGAMTWLIAYPWVMVIGQFMTLVLSLFGYDSHHDQVAVEQVKEALSDPLLLTVTVIVVVGIVPFIEELLFRGFLQTWLKFFLGRYQAIAVTSLIFASFHFSTSQGIENIEFLLALFVLSCYLGFIRERQNSLWASIGLHSTFNLITITFLIAMSTH